MGAQHTRTNKNNRTAPIDQRANDEGQRVARTDERARSTKRTGRTVERWWTLERTTNRYLLTWYTDEIRVCWMTANEWDGRTRRTNDDERFAWSPPLFMTIAFRSRPLLCRHISAFRFFRRGTRSFVLCMLSVLSFTFDQRVAIGVQTRSKRIWEHAIWPCTWKKISRKL